MLNFMKKALTAMLGALALCSCSYVPDSWPSVSDGWSSMSNGWSTVSNGWTTISDGWSCLPDFYYFSNSPYKTTVQIKTTSASNCGAPLYVLVKSTDFSSFLIDDYQKIANMVTYPNEEDTSCLEIFCLVPGSTKTLRLEIPEDESIAVYCLFTEPGAGWKRIFDQFDGCRNIKIVLGEHDIQSVEMM